MGTVVCGIDPGLAATGYAVVLLGGVRPAVLDAGVCRVDRGLPITERLVRLESDVASILEEQLPSVVAVEELYAHYAHPRTAILMGHARGVLLWTAARRGIEVRSYAATRIKRYLTGNGRAGKSQVQRAVQRELGLAEVPEPPDLADALAIALCCAADVTRKDLVRSNGRRT
jgi:crossover junction endodeoxyribonuclease RuvC